MQRLPLQMPLAWSFNHHTPCATTLAPRVCAHELLPGLGAGMQRCSLVVSSAAFISALQEILLILEEYWSRNPQLQAVPIYQASGLAAKAMTIYQTYIEMMNEDIRKAFQVLAWGFGTEHTESMHMLPLMLSSAIQKRSSAHR